MGTAAAEVTRDKGRGIRKREHEKEEKGTTTKEKGRHERP
jgi:hypothetical protein